MKLLQKAVEAHCEFAKITSYALRLGLWAKHPLECIVVISVQKEVAERAIAMANSPVVNGGARRSAEAPYLAQGPAGLFLSSATR
ncbi:MAG: hypothetical protein U0487_02605 [Patescibacteria group bacterium]